MDTTLSYTSGPPLPEGSYTSCWQQILDATHRYPDSLALISMHQEANLYGIASRPQLGQDIPADYLRWTYQDLELAGTRVATSLASMGVSMVTPVFTFLANGVEYVLAYWATSALGCTFVPLNVRQLEHVQELEHMIDVALLKCQSRTAVVVASSNDVAKRLDGIQQLSHSLKIVLDESPISGWHSFGSLLETRTLPPYALDLNGTRPYEHTDSIIMFTSGTTSLPKGCHWHYPHSPSASFAMRDAAGEAFQQMNGDATAIIAPNNHCLGFFYLLMALRSGATALFPRPSFEAEAFLESVEQESVTHTVTVPTMIGSISDVIKAKEYRPSSFKHIMIAGDVVSPEILHECMKTLGSQGVEVIFGMTEGVFISSGRRRPEELIEGADVSVGRCLPGCQIKICDPESRHPTLAGKPGELHYQCVALINNYIDRQSDDFYLEGGELWFCTGDQAVLHPDGRLFITGRYKDMIIRGGENISPAAVESCIAAQLPNFSHLNVQVIGVADAIAGEVPVGITAIPTTVDHIREIKHTISTSMGNSYALDEVLSIQDLGLNDFPKTLAGKIQKLKLKDLAREYYKTSTPEPYDSQLVTQVKQVWARAIGVGVEDLSLTTEIAGLGDSITLMRVKDRLFKQTGVSLSLQEITSAKTMKDLVDILQSRSSSLNENHASYDAGSAGPPNIEDMVHVSNNKNYEATKRAVTSVLKPHRLGWRDVRDVFPAYDTTRILARDGTFDRWSYEIAFVTKGHSVDHLASALLKTFANNPMQTSFLIWGAALLDDNTALHVTVDQQEDFLKSRISYGGVLPSLADLKAKAAELSNHPALPGPLVHVTLYYTQETQSAAMLYNIHHAIADATFSQLIFEDLDLALSGQLLQPHLPYKIYCDSLFALKDSPAARQAVEYHVDKLKDLSRHKEHIWPPSTLPIHQNPQEEIEYTHAFPASTIQSLCHHHCNLTPSAILKAAFTLFLLTKTSHTHALFSHLDSGRDRFPFLPSSLAASSPKLRGSDVGGQTLQVVTNLIPAPSDTETVLQFLYRMQVEQDEQHNHSAAPWSRVMAVLDPESAALIPGVANRCMFNWLGRDFEGQVFENLEVFGGETRKDEVGFTVEGALRNGEVVLRVRGAVFGMEELERFAKEVEQIVRALGEERNWDVPVRMLDMSLPLM